MSKILIFSDIHLHVWKNYSRVLENGLNSRLQDGINVIKTIENYSIIEDIDLILFTGDWFHVKRQIYVSAFNAAFAAMKSLASTKIPIAVVCGNHDQADKHGSSHSLFAFRELSTVIDTPGWVKLKGVSGASYDVLGVPYTESAEHLRAIVAEKPKNRTKHRIFAGHLGIQGAKVGADFVYNNPHDPDISDLNQKEFSIGFCGHYHLHQQIGDNFWYVGAPMHHTWGDKDDHGRGFLVWDSETNLFERIPIKSPKFVEVEDLTQLPELTDDFVRIVSNKTMNQDELLELREKTGAYSVELVLEEEEVVENIDRLGVSPQMSQAEVIQSYIKSGIYDIGELNPDYLIELGKELAE